MPLSTIARRPLSMRSLAEQTWRVQEMWLKVMSPTWYVLALHSPVVIT